MLSSSVLNDNNHRAGIIQMPLLLPAQMIDREKKRMSDKLSDEMLPPSMKSRWWWSVPFIARANNRPVWTMWSEDWLSLQTEGDVSSQSLSFLRLSFFHCDYCWTALKNECRVSVVVVVVVNNALLLTDQPVKRPRMTDWPRNRLTTTTITCRKWEKECRVFREEEKNREGQNKFKK